MSDNTDSRLARIEDKLDKLDDKLTVSLTRLSTAETSIEWIRGHLKISLSIAVAVTGSLIGWLVKLLTSSHGVGG